MQTAREFVIDLQKRLLQADSGEAAAAELPKIFDRDAKHFLNGEPLGWDWLEEHVRQLHTRLKVTAVDVTHAARDGNIIVERHTITAVDRETNEPWQMEVMAAFELSPEGKVTTSHELAQIRTGKYEGGW